jgi:hypothetical protein
VRKHLVNAFEEELAGGLGSSEDLAQVARNPMLRARDILHYLLSPLFGSDIDEVEIMSIRLYLAYVHLSFCDYSRVCILADFLLEGELTGLDGTRWRADKATLDEDHLTRFRLRIRAIARMYGAEASIALGDTIAALRYIVDDRTGESPTQDKKSFILDSLARDLAGDMFVGSSVPFEDLNVAHSSAFLRAQSSAKSAASAVIAKYNLLNKAAELAFSAQQIEDFINQEKNDSSVVFPEDNSNLCLGGLFMSPSRQALLHSLLRAGNHKAALSVLRSLA